MPNLYKCRWGSLQGAGVGEGERSRQGLHGNPCNREAKTIGDLNGPRLGGLSTTPSLTFSFEKSMVVEAASVAENKTYGLEN